MNLEEMVRTQRHYIDSFTCPGEYDAGEAEILAEIGRLRKELVAERTVRETCARVADQLQAALEAHRRFHGKVGCPGKPECYVCEADAPDADRARERMEYIWLVTRTNYDEYSVMAVCGDIATAERFFAVEVEEYSKTCQHMASEGYEGWWPQELTETHSDNDRRTTKFKDTHEGIHIEAHLVVREQVSPNRQEYRP